MIYDLVFEGGGARGAAFAGALQALQTAGIEPGRLLGTSAGAIVATLVAVGYQPQQIMPTLTERLRDGRMRLATFNDIPAKFDAKTVASSQFAQILREIDLPLLPESLEQRIDRALLDALLRIPAYRQHFSLVERGGIYSGDAFLAWLREVLDDMDGLANASLAELYEHTGRELTVVAADVTAQRLLILNRRTAPRLPIVWAVRMSAGVPFYWQEVIWQAPWGPYRGDDISGHAVVDGGVLSSFPLELFVSHDSYVTDIMGTPKTERVVGFLVDESRPLPDGGPPPPAPTYTPTIGRGLRLIETMLKAHDKFVLEAFDDLVVRLPAAGFSALDFDISEERLRVLIDAAFDETRLFLQQAQSQGVAAVSTMAVWQARHVDRLARQLLRQ